MKKIGFLCLIFICLVPLTAHSKRIAPAKVTPVIYDGVRYEAPAIPMGYILAYNATTGKLLWEKKLYEVQYNPKFETDVQDVFIKELKIEKGDADYFLVAIDEQERLYRLDIRVPQPDFIYKEIFPQKIDLPVLTERSIISESCFEVDFQGGFNNEKVILLVDNAPLFSKTITSDPRLGLADNIKLRKEANNVNLTIILSGKKIKWTCLVNLSNGSYIGVNQNEGQILVNQSKNPFLYR